MGSFSPLNEKSKGPLRSLPFQSICLSHIKLRKQGLTDITWFSVSHSMFPQGMNVLFMLCVLSVFVRPRRGWVGNICHVKILKFLIPILHLFILVLTC